MMLRDHQVQIFRRDYSAEKQGKEGAALGGIVSGVCSNALRSVISMHLSNGLNKAPAWAFWLCRVQPHAIACCLDLSCELRPSECDDVTRRARVSIKRTQQAAASRGHWGIA